MGVGLAPGLKHPDLNILGFRDDTDHNEAKKNKFYNWKWLMGI